MESDEDKKSYFMDRVIVFQNGESIIGRIVINEKLDNKDYIHVLYPMVVYSDNERIYWNDWNIYSKNDAFTFPLSSVLTIAIPTDEMIEIYRGFIEQKAQSEKQDEIDEKVEYESSQVTTIH